MLSILNYRLSNTQRAVTVENQDARRSIASATKQDLLVASTANASSAKTVSLKIEIKQWI